MRRLGLAVLLLAACAGPRADLRTTDSPELTARYERAVAMHEAGRLDDAWREWWGTLAAGGHSRDWPAVALAAARRLETVGPEPPGGRGVNGRRGRGGQPGGPA